MNQLSLSLTKISNKTWHWAVRCRSALRDRVSLARVIAPGGRWSVRDDRRRRYFDSRAQRLYFLEK